VSALLDLAKPRRIKASHRRRRKCASGHRVYIMNNPLSGTDPTGYDADPSVGTNIPGVEAVGTETSATGSHLPSASAFGNELAGTGKKDNGTQTQGAVAPSKPSASPAIDSNASTFGSHPAFQESTASGSSGTIDASGCAEAGVPCHVQSASAPESNGAFGAPPSANEDVSIARQLLRFGAKVEEAIVDLFSGAAETKVAGEVGEAGAFAAGVSSANGTTKVTKEITLSRSVHGEAAHHAEDAIREGHPDVLTIERGGAAANRKASTGAFANVPGKHLDEYPPAMFKEGGSGASVRPISPRYNMSAGACIGNACRGLPNGTQIRIKIGN
jgi:hypothetical protein